MGEAKGDGNGITESQQRPNAKQELVDSDSSLVAYRTLTPPHKAP